MAAQPVEMRLARLESASEQIDKRLESLERHLEARFNGVDLRFAAVEERLGSVEAGQWRQIAATTAMWSTTMLAILGLFFRR